MNFLKNTTYLFLLFTLHIFSQQYINVSDIGEYNAAIKEAIPGTTIILENGIWENVYLQAYGKGTKEKPITIKAKNAGKVIISGDSRLQIFGEYITVEGLWFKDGNPTKSSIVAFKKNDEEFANNCRFTNNAITYFNPQDSDFKNHWVGLWGKNNRVDHNNFSGKTNQGTTLVVWLKGDAHIENNHLIDSNLFGARPDLGEGSGETIRIGTTKYSKSSSKTIVENNTFKGCDGDIELISNKSSDNIYRNNLFLESRGALSLRLGNNTLVENNVFMGNDKPNTGGMRIGGEGHIVRNNLLIGLKGVGNRSPIVLMNGTPNPAIGGNHQVNNVDIQNNTIIDCNSLEFGANNKDGNSLEPINTIFSNNLIKNRIDNDVSKSSDDISGIEFKNNIVQTEGAFNRYLYRNVKIDWKNVKSIPMPASGNEFLNSNFTNDKTPKVDIVGAAKNPFTVGAFNLDNTKLPKALKLRNGASWDTKVLVPKFVGKTVVVEPGVATLNKAIKKANGKTLLKLKDGVYYVNREQKINTDITIQGNKKTIIKSEEKLEKPFKSFFKINEKSTLILKNLTIDGEVNDIKYAVISPSKGASYLYKLFVDNCVFTNFDNDKGYIIRAYGNTTADTISIKNSYFKNSYRGINFHAKENTGATINANNIIVENSIFQNIEGFAIKYTNISKVSPKKGNLSISNCIFSQVNNVEKGKIIDNKAIYSVDIKNCVFEKNAEVPIPVNLIGRKNSISNCLFHNSGIIKVSKGAIKKNILYKKPKWKDKKNFIPNKKSPLLEVNNNIDRIGVR